MAEHVNSAEPVPSVAAIITGAENPLRSLSTKAVKTLYRRARSVRTLCFFWLLVMAMSIVEIYGAQPGSAVPVVGTVFVLVTAAAFLGTWRFQHWGRILSIALCVVILLVFPWGTIFGILGLAALIGSKPLFGGNRLSQAQLQREIEYRRAHNVA
jgi:thiol:disulfide interchange protein